MPMYAHGWRRVCRKSQVEVMSMMSPPVRAALLLAVAAMAAASPENLDCSRGITVGSSKIMNSAIVAGGSTNLKLAKEGAAIACGGEITAGDSLTFDMSGEGSKYVIEATSGAIAEGKCSNKARIDTNMAADAKNKAFTVPASGSVTVRAAWASQYGIVTVSSDCTYTVKAAGGESSGSDGTGGGTVAGSDTTTPIPKSAAAITSGALVSVVIAFTVTMMTCAPV